MTGEFTLGIEEEFQIIDPRTRELRSVVAELMDSNTPLDHVQLQSELHQSTVEVATDICGDISQARDNVVRNRRSLARIAERCGLRIAAASTHPFARWQDQTISDSERYLQLVGELQDVARANLIFGMHVHVGIPDRDEAIAVFNSARYFLPHLLALSVSSPFFDGRRTGLQSSRTLLFKRLPRTGIPGRFEDYVHFEKFVQTLVDTGCIDDGSRIWWDLRPHPRFDTLEFRICDLPTRVDHVISIAALTQAIVAKLTKIHRQNLSFAIHRPELMNENKWRAARYGVSGALLDLGKSKAVPFRVLGEELIDFVDDVVDELGSRDEVAGIRDILKNGTSADHQLQVFDEAGGDFRAVVDYVLEETMRGVESE